MASDHRLHMVVCLLSLCRWTLKEHIELHLRCRARPVATTLKKQISTARPRLPWGSANASLWCFRMAVNRSVQCLEIAYCPHKYCALNSCGWPLKRAMELYFRCGAIHTIKIKAAHAALSSRPGFCEAVQVPPCGSVTPQCSSIAFQLTPHSGRAYHPCKYGPTLLWINP